MAAVGASTRTWEQSRFEEFEKGVADRVAIRSDGKLFLAPRFVEVFDAPVAHLWTLARDSRGNLYAAGGPGARVFRIPPSGSGAKFFETEALDIHALAVDRRDNLYAATSPDSKLFRIDPQGRGTQLADIKVKYVWAMAFSSRGDLFLATGDKGEIWRIDSSGRPSLFFQTDESHVRSLLIDRQDNLIAGTDPGGLVIRIPAAGGAGFVMYQSTKKEVTALTLDQEGAIYAAGVGTRARPTGLPPLPSVVPPPPATPVPSPIGPTPAPTTSTQPLPSAPLPPVTVRTVVTGGSEVFRIGPDGAPRKLWTSTDEIVYALGLDPTGKLVIGTGNSGRIFRIESDHVHSLLMKAAPSQVTALLREADGRLFVATANVGKVYRLGPELEPKGSFESEVFDAGGFSAWGRLQWKGDVIQGASLAFETRSGNLSTPAQYWSSWSRATPKPEGAGVDSPAARFLQWRALLQAGGTASPMLDQVTVAYRPKNAAPAINQIEITPPNYRFPDPPAPSTSPPTLTLPAIGSKPSQRPAATLQSVRPMNFAKGYLGVRWLAQDENEDDLIYKVEIRGANEQNWNLLDKDLDQPQLSWDSTAFADGMYQVRVTASDSPSNPGGEALTYSKESEPFPIDNTPPVISSLTASREGSRLHVRFRAADSMTRIKKSDYSVDGSEWRPMLPVSRLHDSRELDFDFLTDEDVKPSEHTVAIRLWDANDNLVTAKAVVR